MAVIVVIAIIAILLVYIGGNVRTLSQLGRRLKLVEEQQIRRVAPSASATNATSVTNLPWTASLPLTNR